MQAPEIMMLLFVFIVGLGISSIPGCSFIKIVRIGDHTIKTKNSLYGVKTVLLDEQKISSRFALSGRDYEFSVGLDTVCVRFRTRWHKLPVRNQIIVNGELRYDG